MVEVGGFVAGGRGDEVELRELHVRGNIHATSSNDSSNYVVRMSLCPSIRSL